MATHDYNLANASGASFRADLNNALQAILTNNSSASSPSTTAAYMFWADTNTGILKIRNSSNDAWVELLQLDGTLTLEDGSASAVALGFRDELNTGIFSSGANNFDVSIAGTTRLNISASGINITGTVTDDGATHDGDVLFTGAAANILFDKSEDALRFNDNAKAVFGTNGDLKIFHNGSNSIINDAGTGDLLFQLGGSTKFSLNSTGAEVHGDIVIADKIIHDGDSNTAIRFKLNDTITAETGGTERLRVNSTGLGIGISPASQLHISSGTSGDCELIIESDTDNSNENDNPRIIFRQDGGTDQSAIGLGNNALELSNSVSSGGIVFKTGTTSGYTNAVTRMTIDGSGSIGMGESSPAENLHIRAGSNVGIRLDDSGQSYANFIYNNGSNSTDALTIAVDEGNTQSGSTMRFRVDASEKARFTADGDFAVGTTSPSTKAHIVTSSLNTSSLTTTNCLDLGLRVQATGANNTTGDIQSGITLGEGRAGLYAFDSGGSASNGLGFWTGSNSGVSERARILGDGNFCVGDTAAGARFHVKGGGNGSGQSTFRAENSDNTELFLIRNDGGIFTGADGGSPLNFTGGSANVHIDSNARLKVVSSSKRYKEDIKNALWGLAEVLKLRPVTFKYKTQGEDEKDKKYAGFTAEEVHDLGLTDFVSYRNNRPESIDYPNMVALMAKAIQELNAKVAVLEAS